MSFCCGLEEDLDAAVLFADSDTPPRATLSDLAAGGDGGSAGADDGASDGDSGGGDAPGFGLSRTCWAARRPWGPGGGSPPLLEAPRCGNVPGGTDERVRDWGLLRATRSTTAILATRGTSATRGARGPLARVGCAGRAARRPSVGPRQEAPAFAGGPTVWERAGRHGPSGQGPAADLGAADDAEPDGDLGRGVGDAEHDGHLGDVEPDGDLGWGDALGGAALGSDDGDSVPTPTAPRRPCVWTTKTTPTRRHAGLPLPEALPEPLCLPGGCRAPLPAAQMLCMGPSV